MNQNEQTRWNRFTTAIFMASSVMAAGVGLAWPAATSGGLVVELSARSEHRSPFRLGGDIERDSATLTPHATGLFFPPGISAGRSGARGKADYGVLGVRASAMGRNYGDALVEDRLSYFFGRAAAISSFSDQMTITSPTVPNGTPGQATVAMQTHGTFLAFPGGGYNSEGLHVPSGNVVFSLSLDAGVAGGQDYSQSDAPYRGEHEMFVEYTNEGPIRYDPNWDDIVSVTFPFTFGTPFPVSARMTASSNIHIDSVSELEAGGQSLILNSEALNTAT